MPFFLILTHRFVPTVLLLFLLTFVGAQGDWQFGHISTSDDFSLRPVTSIAQDARGQMWFGTNAGLLRHDGRQIKKLLVDTANTLTRRANDISAVVAGRDGDIWLGTGVGVVVYEPKYECFVNHPEFGSESVNVLVELPSGRWVASGDQLYFQSSGDHKITLRPEAAVVGAINNIVQVNEDEVWVGGERGLLLLPIDEKLSKQRFFPTSGAVLSLIRYLGIWYVGTADGLYRLELESVTFERTTTGMPSAENDYVTSLTTDQEGRLWVGTYGGIYVIDGPTITNLRHQSSNKRSLSDDKVKVLHADRSGTVWIGSYFGGLNTWNRLGFQFSSIGEASGNRLLNSVVSAIVEGEKGILYFGTTGMGFTIFDPATDTYRHVYQLSNGKPIGTIRTLLYQDENNLWIGTFQQGLVHYNPATGITALYGYGDADLLADGNDGILSLLSYGADVLVGTSSGNLLRFDTGERTFRQLSGPGSDNWGAVRSLLRLGDERVCVGTSRGVYDIQLGPQLVGTGAIRSVKQRRLSTPETAVFVEDLKLIDGKLWVATIDRGVFRETATGHMVDEDLDKATTVYSIVSGPDGSVWMSTEHGLLRYDPGDRSQQFYDRRDGVDPNAFQHAAGHYASDGRYYFGGASGITVFDPANLKTQDGYVPQVLLTELELHGKTLSAGDESGVLNQSIGYVERIDLAYDQRRVSLNFVMPNFLRNSDILYRYRLLGYEEEWRVTGEGRVTYALEAGGSYTFQVTGENSDGRVTAEPTRLTINVAVPPWRSGWAYGLYLLVICGCTFFILRAYRSRLLMRRRIELEKRERELQRKINRQQEVFFTNISHEFRTPLTLIAGNLERSLSDYQGPNKVYRQLIAAKRSTDRLARLVNDLLKFKRLGNRDEVLQAVEADLLPLIQEIFESFSLEAEQRNITYALNSVPTEVILYFEATKIEEVFYNLLSNAFKYTPDGGSVSMLVKRRDSTVDVSVIDTGRGIRKEELYNIFQRFHRGQPYGNRKSFGESSGMGLGIARDAIEQHGGNLEVISEPGRGSCFVVSLPCGSSHLSAAQLAPRRREVRASKGAKIAYLSSGHTQLVLLVEDNPEVAELLREALAGHYRVKVAHDGQVAYDMAVALKPHLVVTDVMIPELDGVALCLKLANNERTSSIPVIMVTAKVTEAQKLEGLSAGAVAYLTKPLVIEELLLQCRNLLDLGSDPDVESGADFPASQDELLIRRALAHLDRQVGNRDFQLGQLTEELGISRSVLFAKFKLETGKSPNDYLLSVRMEVAAELLASRELNVSEVAYRVGYGSPSYFSRSFSKYHGQAPSQYAEKYSVGKD